MFRSDWRAGDGGPPGDNRILISIARSLCFCHHACHKCSPVAHSPPLHFSQYIPHVQSVSSHQVLPQNQFLLPILCHFRHPLLHLPHGPPPPPQQSPLTPNTTNRIHLISPLKCVLCSSHASLADHFQPIDVDVFQQIIDLDEDDSYEFSRSMVEDFYSQAEETFDLMDTLLCVLSPHCPHPLPHLSPLARAKTSQLSQTRATFSRAPQRPSVSNRSSVPARRSRIMVNSRARTRAPYLLRTL